LSTVREYGSAVIQPNQNLRTCNLTFHPVNVQRLCAVVLSCTWTSGTDRRINQRLSWKKHQPPCVLLNFNLIQQKRFMATISKMFKMSALSPGDVQDVTGFIDLGLCYRKLNASSLECVYPLLKQHCELYLKSMWRSSLKLIIILTDLDN